MKRFATTIADDAGKAVRVFDPAQTVAMEGRHEDPALSELRGRMLRSAIGGLSANVTPARAAMMLSGVVGMVVFFVLRRVAAGMPFWGCMAAGAAVGFAWAHITRRLVWMEHRRVIATTLLSEGRCATCAYPLAQLPEAGSVVSCPECGSVWKRARIGLLRATSGPPAKRGRWNQWTQPPIITDDRDRALRLTPVSKAGLVRVLGVRRGEEARRAVMGELRWRRVVHCGIIVLWLCGSMLPLVGLLRAGGTLSQQLLAGGFALSILTFAVFCCVNLWRIWTGRGSAASARIKGALLAAAVCPSCAGDLRGGLDAGDGLRECAACGAAWKLPPGATAADGAMIAAVEARA